MNNQDLNTWLGKQLTRLDRETRDIEQSIALAGCDQILQRRLCGIREAVENAAVLVR